MENILFIAVLTFWATVIVGAVVTAVTLPWLRKVRLYRTDRKMTMYGTEATEFNIIRKTEEQTTKKKPVPRMGGLTLLPTLLGVVIVLGILFDSPILWLSAIAMAAVSLVAIYDDLIDIGIIRRKRFVVSRRLLLLWFIAGVCGYGFYLLLPDYMTFLPFGSFETVRVDMTMAVLFACWFIFWQLGSIIDGIDGLAGSVFLVLFLGTAVLSIVQGNIEALLLSTVGAGAIVPWLGINYAPAKAYLTETGVTPLIMLFSCVTFLLGTGENPGDGLWAGMLFGAVLIVTWLSNILQLLYRKKTGRKLFRIAPVHHHFEAVGIPGPAVVSRYLLVTVLCVLFALSLVLFAL